MIFEVGDMVCRVTLAKTWSPLGKVAKVEASSSGNEIVEVNWLTVPTWPAPWTAYAIELRHATQEELKRHTLAWYSGGMHHWFYSDSIRVATQAEIERHTMEHLAQ